MRRWEMERRVRRKGSPDVDGGEQERAHETSSRFRELSAEGCRTFHFCFDSTLITPKQTRSLFFLEEIHNRNRWLEKASPSLSSSTAT